MGWMIFRTEAEAREYSHLIARQHGYGKEGDTCQYWYLWQETIDGQWAIQCPDGTINNVRIKEQTL